ncbi:N-acetyltransferase family protein [Ferrovibrio sp.]|uniref:GNAT family N-acetyltransferase n=1 Tax=Ferrovibrio sp. TaxID=1917215 RepID=UPI003D1142E3
MTGAATGAVIRPIREADLAGYLACLDRVARERIYLAFAEAPSPEQVQSFLGQMIRRGLPFVVAEHEAAIVGWCDIFAAADSGQRPGFGHVGRLGMGLDEGHRRQGLGEAMLRAVLDLTAGCNIERVELEVYASNEPAIALYRKFGFETEGTRRRARKLDGRYDDILMMARLRPPQM